MREPLPRILIKNFQPVTFENGWTDFGSSYNPVGYYKDPYGIVHLRGLTKSGGAGTVIFTLPTGFRPLKTEIFAGISNAGAADLLGRTDISADGGVHHVSGGTAYHSLDGITFRAVSP